MKEVIGYLLKASDPTTGVEFEEFYPVTQLAEAEERAQKHLADYPYTPIYLVKATEYRTE